MVCVIIQLWNKNASELCPQKLSVILLTKVLKANETLQISLNALFHKM